MQTQTSKYVVDSMEPHTSKGPSDLHKVTNAGSRFSMISADVVDAAIIRHCETSKEQLEALKQGK